MWPESNSAGSAPALDEAMRNAKRLLSILLDPRGAQAGKAVAVDRILPGEKLFDRQGIAGAGLFERQQAAAHRGNDLSLAADHPAARARSRQIRNGQRTAVGPDDVFDPRAMRFGHWYSHTHKLILE